MGDSSPAGAIDAATTPSASTAVKGDPKFLTLALIQMRCDGTPADNLEHAAKWVNYARTEKGADLVVLPELFTSPYFCRDEDIAAIAAAKKNIAEPIPEGRTYKALAEMAKANRVVLVGGSIFEFDKACNKYFNTSVVFGADGQQIEGLYRKTHIPHDPGFWEQHYFSPGDTGIRVFNTPVGKLAVQICYDQWFPEAARLAALKGAEILVYPTAIGDVDHIKADDGGNWREIWTAAQVGHAACNNMFVAAVNRVGREGNTTFWGGSFVADPWGRALKQGGVAEEVVVVRIDRSLAKRTRDAWRFFKERQPDKYADLTKVENAPG